MSNFATDPNVLLVAELIEKKTKLQQEQKELQASVEQKRDERAEMRQTYQEELVASQIAADSAASRRRAMTEAREAKVAASTLGSSLSTLRSEIQEARREGDAAVAEFSEEAEALRSKLACQDAQLKQLQDASAAQSARVAASATSSTGSSDALMASLRQDVGRLTAAIAEFRTVRDSSVLEADALRASHDEAQQMAVEADVVRVAREAVLQQQLRDKKAEADKLAVQLGNAKEHCSQLRTDCRSRVHGEYAGRIARSACREQGCQTRRVQEDVRLREQVRDLSEQIEELKQAQADTTPWWSLCLRGGGSSGGAAGAQPALPAASCSEPRERVILDAARPLAL